MKGFEASVLSARYWARVGRLADWVEAYLTSGPGANEPLADYLKLSDRHWTGPILLPTRELVRQCGPEPEMLYHEPLPIWERRVEALQVSIEDPEALPPLIAYPQKLAEEAGDRVHRSWVIADGAHRFEALKRRGTQWIWSLVWFEDRKKFAGSITQQGTAR